MKYKGKTVKNAYEEVVAFPRQDGDIVFIARAVVDYEPFEKLCPRPKPPLVQFAGSSEQVENVEDVDYVKALGDYSTSKTHWMIITSLRATKELEWDTIKFEDSTTWDNYEEELQKSGFSPYEINRIINTVISANGMDQEKIDQATASFLVDRAAIRELDDSQNSELPAMPSGVPASALASDPSV